MNSIISCVDSLDMFLVFRKLNSTNEKNEFINMCAMHNKVCNGEIEKIVYKNEKNRFSYFCYLNDLRNKFQEYYDEFKHYPDLICFLGHFNSYFATSYYSRRFSIILKIKNNNANTNPSKTAKNMNSLFGIKKPNIYEKFRETIFKKIEEADNIEQTEKANFGKQWEAKQKPTQLPSILHNQPSQQKTNENWAIDQSANETMLQYNCTENIVDLSEYIAELEKKLIEEQKYEL